MTIAANNWCIKIGDKVYGPYRDDQMKTFAAEGRLAPTSNVAPAGSTAWQQARQFSQLALLFPSAQPAPAPEKSFGRAGRGGDTPALPDGALSNFFLIFDPAPGTAGRLEYKIRHLGDAFRITENVWCVSSTQSALGLKNALTPDMMSREFVIVVDAARGRTIWHNCAPEAHSHLTRAFVRSRAKA